MSFKYFGTDGIRGKANVKLTPELAYKVGRYLGYKLSSDKAKVLIGRDTRLSGEMLESALAAGFMASGCDVDLLGVVVTPLVAYILKENDYACGIMISASHNPYFDNGLKIMNHDGLKIDEFLQEEIEDYIDGKIEIPYMINENIGRSRIATDLITQYNAYLEKSINTDLSGLKIMVDAANGSAYDLVKVFNQFNLEYEVINNQPDGININTNCGSTHPETLRSVMQDHKFDAGVAFDGDGDRLIFVDENNNIVDGDGIMYILSNYYAKHKMLENDTTVVTVMSNLGLLRAFDATGTNYVITDVGDKNVFEKMNADNFVIGGEQSGHIILKNHSNMGDGLLVALKILSIMKNESKTLSELLEGLVIYPQLLVNHKVKDKNAVLTNKELVSKISSVEDILGKEGRVLVRPSGTEPLIRVMIEAKTQALCDQHVGAIIDTIKQIER
ncbi:MAG: phosphoglucosamine mutase [Erysipelothrix sp.]|nr:phosphoglucosamine mutase [Erysipelothrix sp.]